MLVPMNKEINTTKAKEVIGFEAEIGLEESVREVIEYMRNRESIVIDEDFVVNDYHVNKKSKPHP